MSRLRQTVCLAKKMGKSLGGSKILFGKMQTEQNPLILTLRLDQKSQAFFNDLRTLHFPPERNFLQAHLTLFHRLPNEAATLQYFNNLQHCAFEMRVDGLLHLGTGVAYRIKSIELGGLRREASLHFQDILSAQDRQPFNPHITVQNKVTLERSRVLLTTLSADFKPFTIAATGLDLWEYLGDRWRHNFARDFVK